MDNEKNGTDQKKHGYLSEFAAHNSKHTEVKAFTISTEARCKGAKPSSSSVLGLQLCCIKTCAVSTNRSADWCASKWRQDCLRSVRAETEAPDRISRSAIWARPKILAWKGDTYLSLQSIDVEWHWPFQSQTGIIPSALPITCILI